MPTPVGECLAEESVDIFSSLQHLVATLVDLRRGPRPESVPYHPYVRTAEDIIRAQAQAS